MANDAEIHSRLQREKVSVEGSYFIEQATHVFDYFLGALLI